MTIRTTLITTGLIAASLVSGAAQAALVDRGGGLIYDTVLDITWLADANYAKTSGYDADGKMTWANANTWAANLVFHDSVRNVDYSDWRLPTTLQPDITCSGQSGGGSYGNNCTGSEMGHLFYDDLGGAAGSSILTSSDADLAKFSNLQNWLYWTATGHTQDPHLSWYFATINGSQYVNDRDFSYYAWAVSPGDVAAVPEAQTYALMLAGLGLIGWRARRRG